VPRASCCPVAGTRISWANSRGRRPRRAAGARPGDARWPCRRRSAVSMRCRPDSHCWTTRWLSARAPDDASAKRCTPPMRRVATSALPCVPHSHLHRALPSLSPLSHYPLAAGACRFVRAVHGVLRRRGECVDDAGRARLAARGRTGAARFPRRARSRRRVGGCSDGACLQTCARRGAACRRTSWRCDANRCTRLAASAVALSARRKHTYGVGGPAPAVAEAGWLPLPWQLVGDGGEQPADAGGVRATTARQLTAAVVGAADQCPQRRVALRRAVRLQRCTVPGWPRFGQPRRALL
jgi:hypothetical protein